MNNLSREELMCVTGGISITGTLISSISRGINTLLDFGRSLGSAIRRISSNNLCSV